MKITSLMINSNYLILKSFFIILSTLGLTSACTHPAKIISNDRQPSSAYVSLTYDPRRGSPAEYDPGASADSKWVELFGSTPNYRSIGITALGGKPMDDEKFRWEFGPMWYRGRLTPESVKTFVVGQEGAQDENISNRAFTGSTGTRVQKFLNHLGIYRSYLFLNTFVYTINGQLSEMVDGKQVKNPKFDWLEQGLDSPIVIYRHKLFDHMLETNANTVALFMGVGAGGKASLATWINARGGKCSVFYEMKNCDTTGLVKWFKDHRGITIKNKILAIGVPHPGGANPNLGGDAQMENIKAGFTSAAGRVAEYKTFNHDWLPSDIDEKASSAELIDRLNKPYVYKGYAPIPFRDFAFNTNWRMGSEGTTSNRWGSNSIQVYSDAGTYNDKNSKFYRPRDIDSGLNSKKTALIEMKSLDLPYESPRYYADSWDAQNPNYDYGPCGYLGQNENSCALSEALVSWPNLKTIGINYVNHDSFGYFGTYRGRIKNARVFILADQTSHDDFFSARALTGTEGQKLQTVLKNSGVGSKYFIQRTLPVDTLGTSIPDLIKGVLHPEMLKTYQHIYTAASEKSQFEVIIALGPVATAVVNNLKLPENITKLRLDNLSDLEKVNTLQTVLANTLKTTVTRSFNGELTTIPREDLPYHTRWWMGSSGDRAARGENYSDGNYYRVWAPYWVSQLYPRSLSQSEKSDLLQKLSLINK